MNNISDIIKSADTTIIDVRTPEEFVGGNVAGSKNIPLNEIAQRVQELKDISGDIVLCCASGGRSGMATQMLQGNGFTNVYNGGGWTDVNYHKNN